MNTLRILMLAAASSFALTCSAVAAESYAPAPLPVASEPAPQLHVDEPLPEALARGVAVIRYRTDNLRILPVFGPAALAVTPRVGHLHVTVDGAPWHLAYATEVPLIIAGLPAGPHKVLVELADANHNVIEDKTVDFVIPMQNQSCAGRSRPMPDDISLDRRTFLGAAAVAAAATQLGAIGPAQAQSSDTHASMGPLKQIDAGVLNVGYAEVGPAEGPAVILLHGWPYDIHSYVEVAPLLASKGYRVIVPYLRGYGTTRFLSDATRRNGQQAVLAIDVIALMDALKVEKAVLGGFDWGARTANIVAALWPERVKAMVSVSGYLIGNPVANQKPLPPKAELQWWYQFYFATERGRAGYEQNRHDFAKLIWRLASPQWKFDDATFDRSAAAFDNPDHVDIVIHNYRWRLGLAEGEAEHDALERKLAEAPAISVPTITLEGDANGAPHPDPASYARKFSGKYAHRLIKGGVGHDLPQEAPREFAEAIVEVDRYS
jgi:pimeloyl-ACP methyl ester carboxylesterase